jgi:hypothetical protein
MKPFQMSDTVVPPDFFDVEKCRERNAMVIKYVGSLIPKGHADIDATPDQIARCFWLDVRVRDLVFNFPDQFSSIEAAYQSIVKNLNKEK